MERTTTIRLLSLVLVLAAVAGAHEVWFRYTVSRAQSLLQRGEVVAAERAFARALTIKSGAVTALVGRARALALEAATVSVERRQKLYDEAAANYQRAAALRPDDAVLLNDIGVGLRDIGRTDLAIEIFRKAAALDPGWGGPDLNLGDTFRDGERYQEALDVLQALENRPVRVATYRIQNVLAQVYLGLGKPHEAEQVLQRAVALNPDYSPVRVSLALALLDQRRYSDATTELETATRLSPQSDTLFFMCQLYALQKRAEDVLGCLGRAIPAGTATDTVRKDPLFRFVQDHPEYRRLVGND